MNVVRRKTMTLSDATEVSIQNPFTLDNFAPLCLNYNRELSLVYVYCGFEIHQPGQNYHWSQVFQNILNMMEITKKYPLSLSKNNRYIGHIGHLSTMESLFFVLTITVKIALIPLCMHTIFIIKRSNTFFFCGSKI